MKALLIICGLVAIALIVKACMPSSGNGQSDTTRPADIPVPAKSDNDKLVVIKGAKYADVQQAVTQFCNMYNNAEYVAIPNLTKLSEEECAVTFPHDLTFDIFCYFVNYMKYPENIFYDADIKAWATTKQSDVWITDQSANKKVMIYIPSDDTEHDNVYLTTSDNVGYKLGFAVGEESQLLDQPKVDFVEPTVTLNELKGKTTEEIK